MKKVSLFSILLLLTIHSVACGPWFRRECSYTSDYGHFFSTLAEPCSLYTLHDNLMRGMMDGNDSIERADSTYQALVALYEEAVSKMNDPWYYPAHKGMVRGGDFALPELRDLCRQKRSSRNMHFAWLEAKCLYQMGAWDDCVMLCDTLLSRKLTTYMRARIQSWQAGAIQCSGHFPKREKEAEQVFCKYGDVRSIDIGSIAQNGGPVEMLDFAYFVKSYQDLFAQTELPYPFSNLEESLYEEPTAADYARYRKELRDRWKQEIAFCDLVASRKPAHLASWYYTAALLSHISDMPAQAEKYLRKAQNCPQAPEEVLPIRCLAMKINMKKNGLFNAQKESEFWELYSRLPRQIAYAQFHKEVLYYVIPRFARAGKHDKVLRFAECFDNPNGNDPWLLDCIVYYSVPMEAAARYADKSPCRSQIYELLGTRCLRNMDYKRACEYLSNVTSDLRPIGMDYQWDHYYDVEDYLRRDPFDADYLCKNPSKNVFNRNPDHRYKLHFAQEMVRLESEIKHQKDPNLRAVSMARYATGMINSFYRCWILTSRQTSSGFSFSGDTSYCQGLSVTNCFSFYNPYAADGHYENADAYLRWQNDTRNKMLRRSQDYLNRSLSTFSDPERAANLLYSLGDFKTLTKKYPNTTIAKYTKAHCDRYIDYFPMKKR